jgi:energy-coupling factor transporter ATP-binding protein EcfA2
MKASKLILENFRCYKNRTEIPLKDLTVFIGKNDIGKSTILEALDIFFNDKDANVKIDSSDATINSGNKEISIGIIFSDYPTELVIDATYPTSLIDEYLLNKDAQLEIVKKYKSGKLNEVALIAEHPSNKEIKDLLSLKIDELREKANSLSIQEAEYNGSVSSSIRTSIRKSLGKKLKTKEVEIVIYKEKDQKDNAAKEIWTKLQEYMPLYSLLQSDRKNEEKDSEIQDPINFSIKQILDDEEIKKQLNSIATKVDESVKEVATRTIKKLAEMNPEIAKELTTKFSVPKWAAAFKDFNLLSDESIPFNKRGSGVRRLILLNFFRAEAERKCNQRNVNDIIYALEEPETSQHPDHQRKLIEAFIELSLKDSTQIFLSTHSPGIAKLLPEDSLILIRKNGDQIEALFENKDILKEIANTLGVLPTIEIKNSTKVKLAICLEGKNDIEFLKNVNQTIPELKSIVDLNDERIITLPLGGSSLQYWVNLDYLGKLNLNQIHIYDSDIGHSQKSHQYKRYVDQINAKGGNNLAWETQKREFENYIHPSLIKTKWNYELKPTCWDETDIAEEIAKLNLDKSESTRTWDQLDEEERKKKKSNIKNNLNTDLSKNLTKELLVELNAFDEIKNWFLKIKEFLI